MRAIRRITVMMLTIVTVISFATVPFAEPAYAADDVQESITLSPTGTSYTVDPGQTMGDTVTVLNDGQTSYDFTVYASPYSVDNLYRPNFTAQTVNSDAYSWIQFEKTTYHLDPRETVDVPFTIRVKNDASPGGHYGVIFVEVQAPNEGKTNNLARKKRVGCIVYATVKGDIKLVGNVQSIDTPSFQTSAPLKSTITVKNGGNTHFPVASTYTVSDIFGNVKYNYQTSHEVLPNTTRLIEVSWDKPSWFGVYKVHVGVELLDYTLSKDSLVLVLPIWVILLFGFIALFGGLYAIRQRKSRPTKD